MIAHSLQKPSVTLIGCSTCTRIRSLILNHTIAVDIRRAKACTWAKAAPAELMHDKSLTSLTFSMHELLEGSDFNAQHKFVLSSAGDKRTCSYWTCVIISYGDHHHNATRTIHKFPIPQA